MRCETQKEIAERENLGKATVNEICSEMADLPKANKATRDAAKHEDEEFQIPLYTVWAKQSKTEGPTHFGNSEIRWVDNLIYLYTQPFDVVADFFAGSGSTIDICRKRSRRYWVSDRKPVVEREKEIRKLDIAGGLPRLPWEDVRLVYLDPPYWKQAQNEYSEDSEDLANMPLDEFTHILTGLITETAKKMTAGHIALLMQPTQWNAPDHQFTDHNVDILRRIKLPIATRIQAPYSTQQCLPQMVNWAKANKQLLVISREIIVWKVG